MRQAAVLAFLSLWLTAGPVSAQTETPAPYHLIRALQSEQDELVRGGGTLPAQGKLLAQIARAFEGTPIEAWRDPKNAAAAAIFLFSGGSSAAVRKLLATGAFAEADTPLLRGAAAYADGREGEARAHLLPIGPEEICPSVGGHLALAQATLIGRRDPPKAMERLDWARLLIPGTIVEETALRRQIFLTADARDFAKLLALAERYRRRFPASAYAAAFQPKLVEIVLDAALASDPESSTASTRPCAPCRPWSAARPCCEPRAHGPPTRKAAAGAARRRGGGSSCRGGQRRRDARRSLLGRRRHRAERPCRRARQGGKSVASLARPRRP